MRTRRYPVQSVEYLKEVIEYDQKTGLFRWKKTLSYRNPAGNIAGTFDTKGYITIAINGVRWRGHRLAWYMMTGQSPENVDHINGDGRDNRLCNLRPATYSQNRSNQGPRKDSSSGHKGVRQDKRSGAWLVRITFGQKHHNIGRYKTLEQAIAAHKQAAERMQGEYAYHLSRGSNG